LDSSFPDQTRILLIGANRFYQLWQTLILTLPVMIKDALLVQSAGAPFIYQKINVEDN
jgi:hypothetical protein